MSHESLFDDIFKFMRGNLEQYAFLGKKNTVLPCNILYKGQFGDEVIIELAVAGYDKESVEITKKEGYLEITGKAPKVEESYSYALKGLTSKDFIVNIPIAPTYKVNSADLNNGLLRIFLTKEVNKYEKIPLIK